MTVNQKYKLSGSPLSFKKWIELEKKQGVVKFMNSDGGNSEPSEYSFAGIKVKYIGLAVLILVSGALVYTQIIRKK